MPSTSSLPPGVRLLRVLDGHSGDVRSIAFDPKGATLASTGDDCAIKLWQVSTGRLIRILEGHRSRPLCVAFDPAGRTVAAGAADGTIRLWSTAGKLLHTLEGHTETVRSVAFDSTGRLLASGGDDGTIRLWATQTGRVVHAGKRRFGLVLALAFDPEGTTIASGGTDRGVTLVEAATGNQIQTLERRGGSVLSLAFDPRGETLVSGNSDMTIDMWNVANRRLLRTVEGHTEVVDALAFAANGRLLVSKGRGGTIRFWKSDTLETVAVIPNPAMTYWTPALAIHDAKNLLAVAADPGVVELWELDTALLLAPPPPSPAGGAGASVHYTTARIVLVGDSGVGKTGLGWRLTHPEHKEHDSTHGQRFWLFDSLSGRRSDGTEYEAILWDLAGQTDYRIIHALFVDDADLALLVFDPTDSHDPLRGVEYWLKQLRGREEQKLSVPIILVGGRNDRGAPTITADELDAFCRARGLAGFISTSAKYNVGLKELTAWMQKLIPWDERVATVTTAAFRQIKTHILALKEREGVIVSPDELRERLRELDPTREFAPDEVRTAVGHLQNYGYVKRLRTSTGAEHILLAPDLLNNLAASFVLRARENPKGLGSLDEMRLQRGDYPFPELDGLSAADRDTLLDSAALLFLNHNVCFRETDPLSGHTYLVFPELINLRKPLVQEDQPIEDGASYLVSGAVENVYSSLVVLLGYTYQFNRTNQWHNHARYEVAGQLVCGFRLEDARDGELDFVLYFGADVGQPVRKLFQGLFESFLAARGVTVLRYEPVFCPACRAMIERSVGRAKLREGKTALFCSNCGGRVPLPSAEEPIQLTRRLRRNVEEEKRFAAQRSRFEQAVYQLRSFVDGSNRPRPTCFISYAWGATEEEKDHERWVDLSLARDLQKAGIVVMLDRWEDERAGRSLSRFVERIVTCDFVIMVGTPLYGKKYANTGPVGTVVAGEADLIMQRLLGTEAEKETVLPVLLAGEEESSFPPLMRKRSYADFRISELYFVKAFELMLDLYKLSSGNPAVVDLVASLSGSELRAH